MGVTLRDEASHLDAAGRLNRRAWALRWRRPRLAEHGALKAIRLGERVGGEAGALEAATGQRTVAWCRKWLGDFSAAEVACDRALGPLTAAGLAGPLGDTLSVLGVLRYGEGLYDSALDVTERGLQTIGPEGWSSTRIDLLTTLATILRYTRSPERSAETLARAAAVATETSALTELARVRHNQARLELSLGAHEAALLSASGSVFLAEEARNTVVLRYALEVEGAALVAVGRAEDALAVLSTGLAEAEAAGDRRAACQILEQRGQARAICGDAEGASADFSTGLAGARELGYPLWERRFHRAIADHEERCGRYPQALAAERRHAALEQRLQGEVADRRLAEMRARLDLRAAVEAMAEERRRNAELSGERDAADEASRTKSAFLANVSHELRTPLNGILGMAQLLARTELDERQRRYLTTILQSGDTLHALVSDLLDLTTIEMGAISVSTEPMHITGILARIQAAVAPQAAARGLGFSTTLEQGTPRSWLGDAERVTQVLLNFTDNALKFTENGGIVLRARTSRDGDLLLEVQDTGPGIPSHHREAIFERFTQLDRGVTRRHGGTGLGLTIAMELAQLMGGEIRVEPAPGGGSVFSLCLPLKVAEGPGATLPEPRPDAPVLVVDGNPASAGRMAALLAEIGYEALTATSEETALTLAAARRPRLLILVSDTTAAERFVARLQERTAAPPPVLLVADGEPREALRAARAAGAAAAIMRPVVADTLRRALAGLGDRAAGLNAGASVTQG